MSVPPNMVGLFQIRVSDANDWYIKFGNTSEVDTAASNTWFTFWGSAGAPTGDGTWPILVDGSSQIYFRTSESDIDIYIWTIGFYDPAQS
jgi:hypothetical protein